MIAHLAPPVGRGLAAVLTAAALTWALPCRAGGPCRVSVAGVHAERWREAAHSLDAEELAAADCATIQIEATGDGAHLTFTTIDGRRAERDLVDPDELRPTIQALLVTSPAPALREPGSPAAPDRHTAPAVEAGPAPVVEAGPAPGSGRQRDLWVTFALLGGARWGNDTRLGPAVSGSASVVVRRWEIGVMGEMEVQRFDGSDQTRAGAKSNTVSLGVVVGRRVPVGDIELLGGGRLAIAALFDDDDTRGPTELRTGAYLGAALPRSRGVRLRVDLAADLVGGSRVVTAPSGGVDGDRPESFDRRWAVSGLVGVEVGAP